MKARLRDLDAARAVAQRLATSSLGTLRQTDTYFRCAEGRLKLREIDGSEAQLIWYRRYDSTAPRASDYLLLPVTDAAGLKQALSGALGVRVVVAKQREVYLHHNVRIHLDRVQSLGTFLELEAVVGGDVDDAAAHQQIGRLAADFLVSPSDWIGSSYSDLLLSPPDQRGD